MAKAVCHKKAEFIHFQPVATKKDIFQQSDWTKYRRPWREANCISERIEVDELWGKAGYISKRIFRRASRPRLLYFGLYGSVMATLWGFLSKHKKYVYHNADLAQIRICRLHVLEFQTGTPLVYLIGSKLSRGANSFKSVYSLPDIDMLLRYVYEELTTTLHIDTFCPTVFLIIYRRASQRAWTTSRLSQCVSFKAGRMAWLSISSCYLLLPRWAPIDE